MRKVLVFAPALVLLAVSCKTDYTINGNGNIFGNNNGPSAVPSVSVTPAPSPSVSPTVAPSPVPLACSLPPSAAASCRVMSDDEKLVYRVIGVQTTIPLSINTEGAYVAALVAALNKAGICASGGASAGLPSDEIAVKVDNAKSETYDVWNASNVPQTLYQSTCYPARF